MEGLKPYFHKLEKEVYAISHSEFSLDQMQEAIIIIECYIIIMV